jgi:hypothetical protein
VFLNGVAVQTRLQVAGRNGDGSLDEYEAHASELPLRLKEENSQVQFRNTLGTTARLIASISTILHMGITRLKPCPSGRGGCQAVVRIFARVAGVSKLTDFCE